MNEIVRELKAGELPDELRGGIDPEHVVRVVVKDLGAAPTRMTLEELHRMREEYLRKHGNPTGTMDDAVRRIRDLRDEWD